MRRVLADYLEIYRRFPVEGTWSKADKRSRHELLTAWQRREYLDVLRLYEVREFIEQHPELPCNQRPFLPKVLAPVIAEDLNNGGVGVAYLFDLGDGRPQGADHPVSLFCQATGSDHSPLELADLVLAAQPTNLIVARYKYQALFWAIDLSIQELPQGVLNGMRKATREDIADMLAGLAEFERLGRLLGEKPSWFTAVARRCYPAWADYLDHQADYSSFQDYLDRHQIDY